MMVRRLLILVLVASTLHAGPASAFEACPVRVRTDAFPSATAMRDDNDVMAHLGARPTASAAHHTFIEWVEGRLDAIPGVSRTQPLPASLQRWTPTAAALAVEAQGGPRPLAVAGPVPYSRPADVTAPLLRVPTTVKLDKVDVTGKIVLRDVVPGGLPIAVFFAVAYYVHDPDVSFDYFGSYERDWISYASRRDDLVHAAAGGAAGVIFVHNLPAAQAAGHYEPYEGRFWDVPGLFVGADEGAVLREAERDGTPARLQLAAIVEPATSRTVRAVLPGSSNAGERIVIASHTDGMNAVWDNGPISILALAKYLAALPARCRPRTFEFVFTTAHLYLSEAGAEAMAEVLDHDYEQGEVALALALEHLGAREYLPIPRTDGGPGARLEATGKSELFAVFATESPALVDASMKAIVGRDLRRTFLLRGADPPMVRFPPHHSYGGEGGPYHQHLIPTVAAITGPSTLYKPAFGMEALDVDLMRRQTIAFGDLIHAVEHLPRHVIAGADTAYRLGRAVAVA